MSDDEQKCSWQRPHRPQNTQQLLLSIICYNFKMRYIPDDNLSYPVLLTLDDKSSGSGFYLNFEGREMYLVTARHVLCKQENGVYVLKTDKLKVLSYDRDISVPAPYLAEINITLLPSENIRISVPHDVVIIKVGTLTKKEGLENQYSITYEAAHSFLERPAGNPSGIVFIPNNRFKKYEDVLISNDVVIFGYPVSLGTGSEIDYKRPLLRKGIIAGKNINNRTIILDCPSYQGNSGGLVLEVSPDRSIINPIGIISGFVPFVEVFKSVHFNYENRNVENSGYSVITPIDVILELITERSIL